MFIIYFTCSFNPDSIINNPIKLKKIVGETEKLDWKIEANNKEVKM